MKIGFVLLSNSDRPIPSTRVASLNMFPLLRAAGCDPRIAFEPDTDTATPNLDGLLPGIVAEGYDVVVFQKVYGASVVNLARQLGQAGIRTVYSVCDFVDVPMAEATDATVCVTDYLKSLYPEALQHKIHVVHDGIERPEVQKTEWGMHHATAAHPLHAVLVTSAQLDWLPLIGDPPPWLRVTIVGRYPPPGQVLRRLREVKWQLEDAFRQGRGWSSLRFLANPRIRCVAWHPADVYEQMRQADIGIIPVETGQYPGSRPAMPGWQVKSENRLSLKMCVGLPVIATPIPSYEPLIRQGENGYLASSPEDWQRCLEALRDPALRAAMGRAARATVRQRYSMEEQARLLLAVFHKILDQSTAQSAS